MGPLTDFWRQREEDEFTGVGGIPVRFVRFRDEKNDRVIVVCPGRIESYVKYAELAYDLVHMGFDVLIIDHRGQGLSGRMLQDTHRGHVDRFSDYVDDFAAFWQQEVQPGPGVSAISLRTPWVALFRRCFCSGINTSVMPLR